MVYAFYQEQLNKRSALKQLRKLPVPIEQGINFASNDYLGLSRNSIVCDAAIKAIHEYGVGATGSRLLSGNYTIIQSLENLIAQSKKTQAALVFNSGFQCNQSVLACLLKLPQKQIMPEVYFDKLNHASLYQAVALSGAQLFRYRHGDISHLQALLEKNANTPHPKFIVTETVFGMDGDRVDLEQIILLAKSYNAFLYLDEAHATGILGQNGYGLSEQVDLGELPCIIMGTFSKALGGAGGYVACSHLLKSYLLNYCPGIIYSTALPPPVAAAAKAAWESLPMLSNQRHTILAHASHIKEACHRLGLNTLQSSTHIVPIVVNSEAHLALAKTLFESHGIDASYVRPPTVPPNTARIRIAVNATHSTHEINQLVQVLKKLKALLAC